MRTVLLTETVDDVGMRMLRDRQDIELIVAPPDLLPALAKANAIGVRTYGLGEELLAKAVSLELVAKHGVGCDNIAVDYLSSRGIPVTITADANASSVAEHTMLLMLAAAKQLTAYDSAVRQGDWNFRKIGRSADLGGRTVLVVGLGRIGRRVAALCRAFGMRVLGHDVETAAVAARESGIEFMPDLDQAIALADIITLHVPSLPGTVNLISARRIAAMRAGTVLVNCARGDVVDEPAVISALVSGQIVGAGLDVFAQEPPSADNPLLRLPNVVLTPHSASLTVEGSRKMAISMAKNILDHFDGTLADDFVVNAASLGNR